MMKMDKKKKRYIVPVAIMIGLGILFIFPNPSTNIIAYMATLLAIALIIAFLIYRYKGEK